MKRKSIATGIIIAGLGIVSSASALPIVENASQFHAVDASQQQHLAYNAHGVSNSSASPVTVVGTVARIPQGLVGTQIVTIVGYNEDIATTTACSIIAVTPVSLGNSAVLKKFNPNGIVTNFNHTWTRSVAFDASEAGPLASFIIRCTLDGNHKSRIHSVRVDSP